MSSSSLNQVARDSGLDALRGFLIVCVVVGHLPLGTFLGMQPWWWGWLNETIYLFHIPLFFALSCVLLSKTGWREMLISSFGIVAPYALWFAWQQHDVLLNHPIAWTKWLLLGNFDSLQSILWFMPALIMVRLMGALVIRLSNYPGALLGSFGLWLFGFANLDWMISHHASIPFGIDVAFVCLPYIGLAVWVERNRARLDSIPGYAWLSLATGLAMWFYVTEPVKTHSPWHKRIDLAQLSVPLNLWSYLEWSLLGTSWFLAFRRVRLKPLEFFGRHSLPIFLIHYEVFKWFMTKPERLPGGPGFLALTVVLIAAFVLPSAMSTVVRHLWRNARWIGM